VNEEALEKVRLKALKAYNDHPKLRPTSRDNLTEMTINIFYPTFGAPAASPMPRQENSWTGPRPT
jgi:hypothetical protein